MSYDIHLIREYSPEYLIHTDLTLYCPDHSPKEKTNLLSKAFIPYTGKATNGMVIYCTREWTSDHIGIADFCQVSQVQYAVIILRNKDICFVNTSDLWVDDDIRALKLLVHSCIKRLGSLIQIIPVISLGLPCCGSYLFLLSGLLCHLVTLM